MPSVPLTVDELALTEATLTLYSQTMREQADIETAHNHPTVAAWHTSQAARTDALLNRLTRQHPAYDQVEDPEAHCHRCGGVNPSWHVDSDRWNLAVGPDNTTVILCPGCFVHAHEHATGLTATWELRPATPFRHTNKPN